MDQTSDKTIPDPPDPQLLLEKVRAVPYDPSDPTLAVRLAAQLLGKTPTGVVKACRRHGIGRVVSCRSSRSGTAIAPLTVAEIVALAIIFDQSRPGNPRWRADGRHAAEDGARGRQLSAERRASVYAR